MQPIFKNRQLVDWSDEGEAAQSIQNSILLRQLIAKLPRQQRRVVTLRLKGFKFKEIAQKLGNKRRTCYNEYYEAKKNLRRMVM